MRKICCGIAGMVYLFSFCLPLSGAEPTLVEASKKDGEVVWYTTMSVPESTQLAAIFEKQYPFVKVRIVRAGGGAAVNRILSEFTAGKHTVDVIEGGAESRGGLSIFKKKGIITPYMSPERKFIYDDLKDKDGFWTSIGALPIVLAYNKNLVDSKSVPKTYQDLLDPKWKGKKILNDSENYLWFGTLLNFWGKDKGLDYFGKLAGQEQVFQRGARGRLQLVIAGEFPLTITYGPHVQGYINRGAPVDWVPLEPVVVNTAAILLAKQAPHPNAAKLFIDFLFSKETQIKLRDLQRIPSRVDVDPEPPRLFKGFKRAVFDSEAGLDILEVADLFNKTFRLAH
jgi:iron(III) transport system substrate-binding protein